MLEHLIILLFTKKRSVWLTVTSRCKGWIFMNTKSSLCINHGENMEDLIWGNVSNMLLGVPVCPPLIQHVLTYNSVESHHPLGHTNQQPFMKSKWTAHNFWKVLIATFQLEFISCRFLYKSKNHLSLNELLLPHVDKTMSQAVTEKNKAGKGETITLNTVL